MGLVCGNEGIPLILSNFSGEFRVFLAGLVDVPPDFEALAVIGVIWGK